MFKIGNIKVQKGASLAPMAGYSDKAFRAICESYNASLTVSEMVSSQALFMNDKKSRILMENSERLKPFGIQVFGHDPYIISLACKKIEEYNPDFIDINAGCPAPKITNNKGGSSLLKTPELIGDIISAMKNVTDKPITLKIRKGFDENFITAVEVAKIAEKAGASMVTVHGRTKEQMYAPPVDINIIKKVKDALKIPVMGNGDVDSIEDYINMIEQTGVDSVAIARGALGKPWIFNQIHEYLKTGKILKEPSLDEKIEIMKTHISMLCQNKGEYVGMREARKHCSWYMKNLKGAAQLRKMCGSLNAYEDLNELARLIKKIN